MNGKVRALVGATGVSAVVAAVALSGGTSAYYYDNAQISGNSISSCKLQVNVDSVATTRLAPSEAAKTNASIDDGNNTSGQAPVKISNVAPGDKFQTVYKVSNVGTCAGDLWADISGHPGDDGVPGSSFNNLWKAMTLSVNTTLPANVAGPHDNGSFADVAVRTPDLIASHLGKGESVTFTAVYELPESGQRESYKSATTTQAQQMNFEVDFGLVQLGHAPSDNGVTHL